MSCDEDCVEPWAAGFVAASLSDPGSCHVMPRRSSPRQVSARTAISESGFCFRGCFGFSFWGLQGSFGGSFPGREKNHNPLIGERIGEAAHPGREPVCHRRDLKLTPTVDVLVSCLKGPFARLTEHRFDCRVAQAALREATPEPQQCLASELQGQVISICQHRHANFALRLCFELLEPHFDAVSVAVQVCECSVLQRLIEHCSCEPQLIVENVEKLLAKQVDSIPCPKSRISDVPFREPMPVSALVREVAYLAGHPHDTGVVSEPVCPCQDLKLSSLVERFRAH